MSAREWVVLGFWIAVVVALLWAAARIAAKYDRDDVARQRRRKAALAEEALDEMERWIG